jgi:di/tricarboxylate transporter
MPAASLELQGASRGERIRSALYLVALVGLMSWASLVPLIPGHPSVMACAAVLVALTVTAWAIGVFKEPVTSLLFFLAAVLWHVAPLGVIFSGLESPAWWLVFGGSITGVAMRTTGLGARFTGMLLARSSASYGHCVAAVVMVSLALAFVMPSTTGRVLLLLPIALSLCDRLGFSPGRPGRTGLVLAVAAACYMPPTSILPANIPNAVLFGAAESLYGIELRYGSYLLLHFPVLGALKSLLLIWVVQRVFPDKIALRPSTSTQPKRLSIAERNLLIVLFASLAFYVTDFLHGISPAWISLAAGIVCLLPQTGILRAEDINQQVHIGPLLYVAAFLGLGAVISSSGLGTWASGALFQWIHLTPAAGIANLLLLAGIAALVGLVTTLPGLPSVLTPLAGNWATLAGLPLYSVLMLQVPVFSTVFFPYQSPPMMIAMQIAGVSIKDATRFCLTAAAVTILILLPLDLAWWWVLGLVK